MRPSHQQEFVNKNVRKDVLKDTSLATEHWNEQCQNKTL